MFLQGLLGLFNKLFFFTGYVGNRNAYPKPLDKEEELRYLELCKKGDATARELLIKHNLRLVAHIAKKYSANYEFDDLISVGSVGLVKGISSYEIGKGTTLATFLARCIENEILMMLRSSKKYRNTVYLQDSLGVDSEGNEFTLLDVLSVKDENIFRQVDLKITAARLNTILRSTLTDREYDIICMRFGLNGNIALTQLETAEKLKISRSYISRIETKALGKIRQQINPNDFLD